MAPLAPAIQQYLPLIVPLLLIQLALVAFGLLDLAHREKTKGPKWLWAVIIIVGQIWGPVLYLLVGREE